MSESPLRVPWGVSCAICGKAVMKSQAFVVGAAGFCHADCAASPTPPAPRKCGGWTRDGFDGCDYAFHSCDGVVDCANRAPHLPEPASSPPPVNEQGQLSPEAHHEYAEAIKAAHPSARPLQASSSSAPPTPLPSVVDLLEANDRRAIRTEVEELLAKWAKADEYGDWRQMRAAGRQLARALREANELADAASARYVRAEQELASIAHLLNLEPGEFGPQSDRGYWIPAEPGPVWCPSIRDAVEQAIHLCEHDIRQAETQLETANARFASLSSEIAKLQRYTTREWNPKAEGGGWVIVPHADGDFIRRRDLMESLSRYTPSVSPEPAKDHA